MEGVPFETGTASAMIKRILVALDPDSDTLVATRYAVEIARQHTAEVTALAVIDMGNIEAEMRGGGIGSMYYGEKLRSQLTTETRAKARELLEQFERNVEGSGVRFAERIEEGVPFQRIVEDMKYHDLLILGKDPHFFYSHPKSQTNTLARVVEQTVSPTLVVGDAYEEVRRVLIAYDGSNASARAMRQFVIQQPFGQNLRVEIINVHDNREADSRLLLELAKSYVAAYGFSAETHSISSNDSAREIITYARQFNASIVVAGAHSVSKLKAFMFGSSTETLLKEFPALLFLDQ